MFDCHEKQSSPTQAKSERVLAGHCRATGDMIAAVRSTAAAFFTGARGSHDWDHTHRVYRLCDRIASAEQADLDVVRIAALLHDIGRARQDTSSGSVCHAQVGARLAGPIVEELPLTERQKLNILHCISTHRFRGRQAPKTLEARVLFDADKLDAIGAIGIARAFAYGGHEGQRLWAEAPPDYVESLSTRHEHTPVHEYQYKLRKIKERLHTSSARQVAEERHTFMVAYFARLDQEVQGLA